MNINNLKISLVRCCYNYYQQQQMELNPTQSQKQLCKQIKNASWVKFQQSYSKKFKKEYNQSTFIIISSLSIVNTDTMKYKMVSMGFGTKSLPRSIINQDNKLDLISDMHAEILAIQGFRRFLAEEINNQTNQYLEWNNLKKKYSLKKQYEIYLYCSQIFCGDCCINREQQSFSGAKPLQYLFSNQYQDHKFMQNILRTKPGRVDLPLEKRSSIMSCSDIIGFFNILGIQGKILFTVLLPIYLSKIIIDTDERYLQNLTKGIDINLRLQKLKSLSQNLINRQLFNIMIDGKQRKISSQFRCVKPTVVILEKQSTRNRQGFDLCGIFLDNCQEWLNGRTGLPQGNNLKNYKLKGKISKFSQNSLRKQFEFFNINQLTFKYEAIVSRVGKLFGEWIDGTGQ